MNYTRLSIVAHGKYVIKEIKNVRTGTLKRLLNIVNTINDDFIKTYIQSEM